VITRKSLPIGLILLFCIALLPFSSSTAQTVAPLATKIPNFDCYRDANSLMAKMAYLAKSYPNLGELVEIGESVERAPIYALEIGSAANADKPHFILLAGLHGNDFSQPEVGLQLAETLLAGYETNADLRWIVENVEIDLILLANPDGRMEAETQAMVPFAEPRDVLSIINGNAVDLESNFCVEHLAGQGCDPSNYEPETQTILTYLEKKLGEPNPTRSPSKSAGNLFVYFSSHHAPTSFAIGNIRIPWFYKLNPVVLTEPANIWQAELAGMLKVLNEAPRSINGNIEPAFSGNITANYPVDYVLRSYGVSSLELSTYPTSDNQPVDCDRYADNYPDNYLKALLKMAKSAAQPYKIGYGPIVTGLVKTEDTATEVNYRAVILAKNQIPDMPESNPITSIWYYIDQPTGTISGALHDWYEINENPYTSVIEFSVPTEGLTPGKHILTLQACSQDEADNPSEVCGLPLSAFLNVPDPENPVDPDPTEPIDPDPTEPVDLDPTDTGRKIIYLPLIGR
jgi:carboxypeptidase T